MRALINTDVLLARFLRQDGFAEDADQIFAAAKAGKIEGLVTALSVMDVYRATREQRAPIVGLEAAVAEGKEHVREILETFEVIPLDRQVLEQALNMGGQDYRNNTLIASAGEHDAAAIITWDEQLQADQAAAAQLPSPPTPLPLPGEGRKKDGALDPNSEVWNVYVPMDGVQTYRRIAEPDETQPMVVVRMGNHTVNDLLYSRAGDGTIGDAIMKYKDVLIAWAADGLDEQRYYCVGVLAEVTLAGELNAVEVAFRRQVEGERELMN